MSTVESINLDEVYAYAIQLAREAGQRILAGSAQRHQAAASLDGPNTKKNSVDRESNRPRKLFLGVCGCSEAPLALLGPSG